MVESVAVSERGPRVRPSVDAWRRLLTGLCVVAFVLTAMLAVLKGRERWAFRYASTADPAIVVLRVEPGSPAYRAGLRTGDRLDVAALTAARRYMLFTPVLFGTIDRTLVYGGVPTDVDVMRGDAVRHVELTIPYGGPGGDAATWLGYSALLFIVAVATLIARRRADAVLGRLLALLLALWALALDLGPDHFETPWAAANAAAAVLSAVLGSIPPALLAMFAMTAANASGTRRFFARIAYASAGIAALLGVAVVGELWFGAGFGLARWSATLAAQAPYSVPLIAPLACAWLAVGEVRGAERTRIVWVVASLTPSFAVGIAIGFVSAAFPQNGPLGQALSDAANLSIFVAAVGIAYAVLNRRLLDVGFALNRTAVFSVVSVLVFGLFVLGEWIIGEWLRGAGYATNVALSAALALALGISVRVIHDRVESVLDNVFFHKRHTDEQAIRRFGAEAAYITDVETLVARTCATLERYANASFADVAIDDRDGAFGGVGENDEAIVALRAWGTVLDLHTVATALRGEFAFPMIVRGRLLGAVIVGPKRSHEPYAPDESDAIASLARGLGASLDHLSAATNGAHEALLAATGRLTVAVETLTDMLASRREMPL